jgi:hypothetical protein
VAAVSRVYARAHLRLDTLARLSVYEVPSSARAHTALETWLLWLDAWAQGDADGARETQIVREECRERCKCTLMYTTVPLR